MCGIAGIIDFQSPPDRRICESMAEVLYHRGPDEAGAYADTTAALAMRRLSIQDVVHGHQPAFSEDGSVVAILNGEIYNFGELRSDLIARGHRLLSASDTEVLPHLYEELGCNLVDRLDGMFAFAIWDLARQRLVLARDRLGKKPLFYRHLGQSVRFSSEIKALFADRSLTREPDRHAIDLYLSLGYVPAPYTAFSGVRSVEPAQIVQFDHDGLRTSRYWSIDRVPGDADPSDAAAMVKAGLDRAVRARLIADVPLGAFLSGGVDSSCVVACMAQHMDKVRTFTIGFEEAAFDERPLARAVANALATEHVEEVVRADVTGLLPMLVWHFDQPFADASMLPTYMVAREARRHVTVALNGDGGDEAFGGYVRVQRIARWASRRPRQRLGLLRYLPVHLDPMHPISRLRRLSLRVAGRLEDAYIAWTQLFPGAALRRMYTEEMRAALRVAEGPTAERLLADATDGHAEPLWRLQRADYLTYLPGDLLPKVDRATMAVSLEARSPMLDHHFVEMAARLPTSAKIGPSGSKVALRQAFRGVVPDEVLDGPKRGFGVPLDEWFRGRLAPVSRALLTGSDTRVAAFMLKDSIRSMLDAHEQARHDHGNRIFALVCLELWLRTYIDQPPPLQPPTTFSLRDFE